MGRWLLAASALAGCDRERCFCPAGGGVAPPAFLDAEPSALEFGELERGTSETRTFTVVNAGGADADIEIHLQGAAFAIADAAPFTLAPGDLRELLVTFTPMSSGHNFGAVDLVTADGDGVFVPMLGDGEHLLVVDGPLLETTTPCPVSGTVRVTNDSARTVVIEDVVLDSPSPTLTLEPGALPMALAPGEGFDRTVWFRPDGPETVSAELVVSTEIAWWTASARVSAYARATAFSAEVFDGAEGPTFALAAEPLADTVRVEVDQVTTTAFEVSGTEVTVTSPALEAGDVVAIAYYRAPDCP